MYPVDAAVGPDHPPFGNEFAVFERALHVLFGLLPVFGMYERRPGLVSATEAAGRQSINCFDLFRPDIDVGLDVPFEGAYMARLLREFPSLLAFAERLSRLHFLGNIFGDADDSNNIVPGVADRDRAY